MRYGIWLPLLVAAALLGPVSGALARAGWRGQWSTVYSHRHYDVDLELYESFEEQTGIKVNLVEGGSDELIERLMRRGSRVSGRHPDDRGRRAPAPRQGRRVLLAGRLRRRC